MQPKKHPASRPVIFILFLTFYNISCEKQAPKAHTFYYWKTTLQLDSADWTYMNSFGGAPLYVRLFDVDFSAANGQAIPVGDIQLTGIFDGRPVIPVIYLTNRVFTQTPDSLLETLASKIAGRSNRLLESFAKNQEPDWLKNKVPEIQLDCDWTATTRDKYFRFLQLFRKQTGDKQLSCTVRLHQFRERKTAGIPPVDRAMLMCYNVADPKNADTKNAILDYSVVESYLRGKDYPLPMDVALSLFSWAGWFRDTEFRGLMNGWNERTFSDSSLFQALGSNRFRILKDTVWDNNYLREGDVLRLDYPMENDLLKTAELLTKFTNAGSRVVFFDWDRNNIIEHESVVKACFARF